MSVSSKAYQYYWQPLRYHPVQSALWNYDGKLAAIVAGRRSGKTVICRRKLALQLPLRKPWPDPIYVYLLPTFAQAKKVAWYPFLNLIPPHWIKEKSKTELSITTIWGSKLYIGGADKPERLEGIPSDFVMIDESCDQQPDLFQRTVLPMLAERDGKCYRLGVPKKDGIGKADFKLFFDRGRRGEGGIASFHWKSADILTPQQIYEMKENMDEQTYREQLEAEFIDIGSSVYYNFHEDNIRDDIYYNPTYEICVGCDFNVSPMSWCLGHYIDGILYIFDELHINNTNTPAVLDFLHSKYRDHLAGWRFFGDATSKARKSNAVRTDYLTIKNDARFGNKRVFFPERNPAVRDRFATVNFAFRNANDKVRLYINNTCKHLINDLNTVAYEEGTTEVEDYSGTDIGHMSDALGYMVYGLMPMRLVNTSIPVVLSTAG